LYGVTLALLAVIGLHRGLGLVYYLGIAVAAAVMIHHHRLIRGRDREACFRPLTRTTGSARSFLSEFFSDFAIRHGIPWI